MPDDFESILDEAERRTNEDLDSRISSLVRLTEAELQQLFPRKADKKRLAELMSIVRSATSENIKRRKMIENVERLAGTVIKLIGKLA